MKLLPNYIYSCLDGKKAHFIERFVRTQMFFEARATFIGARAPLVRLRAKLVAIAMIAQDYIFDSRNWNSCATANL